MVTSETYYMYRVGRPGSITSNLPNPKHAKDYLDRICSTMEFMTLNYNLIKADLPAWHHRLGQKGLNYISMCLKTKTPISWVTIFILFYKIKNINFLFKLSWRFLRYFLTISLNYKKKNK